MERVLNKITSARWLIAVIMTIVFGIMAIRNTLNTEFMSIYTMIIAFYFNKERSDK